MSFSPPPNFPGGPKTPPQKHPPTGRGIGIAFLDTGISPVLDFITPQNRIVAFRDFIGGKRAPYDDNGHGTHVTCSFFHFPMEKAPTSDDAEASQRFSMFLF